MLPEEVLAQFDLGKLTDVSARFFDEGLRNTSSDVLFTAPFEGHAALVHFLLEHQSGPDDRMPLRVLDYVRSIWEKWLGQEARRKALPPVVTVVVHHGPRMVDQTMD